jgi:uncharacterized protein involved in exopolysaccharide biosynthesis
MFAMVLGLAITALVFCVLPPMYISVGSLWETEQLRLPDAAVFTEDRNIYLGTQSELLRSRMMREWALNLMRSSDTNKIVSGGDGNPLPVEIQVFAPPKSSVYTVEAAGVNPGFTAAFLNALMREYVDYRKQVRRSVSGETMASVSEQVQRLEKNLKIAQDALAEYESSNNFAVLQAQAKVAVECLARLNSQLSDLQLEDLLLDHPPSSDAETARHRTLELKMEHIRDSINDWNSKITQTENCSAEVQRLQESIQRCRQPYDRLTTMLENFDISRQISMSTLNVLEPASPAKRTYARERHALFFAGLGGLGGGIVVVLLAQWFRARRRKQT